MPIAIWELFSEFFIFCNLFHEKPGNCLPILHEATCDNYFIVKWAWLIQFNSNFLQTLDTKTAGTDLTWSHFQTFDGFPFPYFNSNILCSVHLFCNRFIFEPFVAIIWLLLKTRTYQVVDFTVLTHFTSNLDTVKLSHSWIAWPEFHWLKHCINLELLSVDLLNTHTCMV